MSDFLEQEEELDKETQATVGKSAAMMSVLIVISRVTGFFRTWAQAFALGVTSIASCYTVANNLPNLLYELVVGGMLVTAFLPVYMSVKKKSGVKGASVYSSNLVSIVLLLLGIVTFVSIIFAGPIVLTQSFGAAEGFDHNLATFFFQFFAIEIVLYALSSLLSGILNAERKYFWSTAAPIFNNFICIASFLLYALFMKSQPLAALVILAIGNPLGVFVQVVMQIPSMKKIGIKIRLRINWHDPALKETIAIGVPALIVTVSSFVTVSVQSSSALQVTTAGAAISYYARLWYTLPYAIVAVPISTALFTELSDAVASKKMNAFKKGIASGTKQILFFLIPLTALLIALSPELMGVLNAGSGTSSFGSENYALASSYLAALATALPFYGICMYLQKVCSSYRHLGLFAVANIIGSIAQVVVCILFTSIFGLNVVAYSSTVFYFVLDIITYAFLRARLGRLGLKSVFLSSGRTLIIGVIGAAVAVAIAYLCTHVARISPERSFSAVFICIIAGIPAIASSFAAAVLFRFPEVGYVRNLIGRKR